MTRALVTITLSCALLLALLTAPALEAGSKGLRAAGVDRILNGDEIDGVERSADWTLSLRLDGRHICGASFIAPRFDDDQVSSWSSEATSPVWALTAAHCLFDWNGDPVDASRLSVWGGAVNIASGQNDPGGEVQAVKKIYLPTSSDVIGPYDPNDLENDIALLVLADSTQDVPNRQSIRLPTVRDTGWIYHPYTAVSTAGWGRTETGVASDQLLEVRLPVVDAEVCQDAFSPFGDTIFPGMTCAGFASGEYDSCQGDSGGPLYYRPSSIGRTAHPVLVGVVSWGRGCGNTDLFGVYTRVAYYLDWIESTVEAHRQGG